MDSSQYQPFSDQFNDEKRTAARDTLKRLANVMVLMLVAFGGVLNFMLYSRPFEGWAKAVAIIPALGISGSLLLFMRANISWFSIGAQERFGKAFSWGLFALEGANSVVEWNLINGSINEASWAVKTWANLGIPVAALVVLAMWKIIIDSDEDAEVTREANLADAIVRRELRDMTLAALDSSENRIKRLAAARVRAKRQTEAHTSLLTNGSETVPMNKDVDAGQGAESEVDSLHKAEHTNGKGPTNPKGRGR